MRTIVFFPFLGTFYSLNAQTDPKPQTPVTNNFLELQAGTLSNIFGNSLTGGKGKVANYLDLANKSDMPEADKQNLREPYIWYSKTLDAQGKDSFQSAMAKVLPLKSKKTRSTKCVPTKTTLQKQK